MRYRIPRSQQVPPGEDKLVEMFDGVPGKRLAELASQECENRSIAVDSLSATLVGQPEGTGNKYHPHVQHGRLRRRMVAKPE